MKNTDVSTRHRQGSGCVDQESVDQDGEEHGGAAGWTIRSPEIRRRRAVAAAEKGPRRGHGREQEGEGKGGGEVRDRKSVV